MTDNQRDTLNNTGIPKTIWEKRLMENEKTASTVLTSQPATQEAPHPLNWIAVT